MTRPCSFSGCDEAAAVRATWRCGCVIGYCAAHGAMLRKLATVVCDDPHEMPNIAPAEWVDEPPADVAPLAWPASDLKTLRETLCRAQTAIEHLRDDRWETDTDAPDIERIGRLIAEIDRHRPLGPDGKHGDLHTPTCGCEDR